MMPACKNNSLPVPTTRLGVYPVGTAFYKDGQEVRGIGVNHWGVFVNQVSSLGVAEDWEADLTAIKQTYGLPFIRVSFGMYSRSSWYSAWYQDQTNFFAKLDAFVAKCEALNLGVVPVLVWNMRGFSDACYDITGQFEPVKNLAHKHTRAWQLFEQYITSVVGRYKNSPAIWAWELGNEVANSVGAEFYWSWKVDGTGTDGGGTTLPINWGTRPDGGAYIPSDKMSMSEFQQFAGNFVALVNSSDPHQRMLLSGSPVGNSFAVNAQSSNTLAADTLTQWNGAATTESIPWIAYRDKPFNVITQHIYPQSLANGRFFNGGEKTQAELIALSRGWADQVGKPLFLGEWGATYHGDPVDESSTNLATEQSNFNAALDAVQTSAKLSAIWNYGGDLASGNAWAKWKLNDPVRSYQLDAIAAANAAMQI